MRRRVIGRSQNCRNCAPYDEVDRFPYTVTKMSQHVILLTSVWALSYQQVFMVRRPSSIVPCYYVATAEKVSTIRLRQHWMPCHFNTQGRTAWYRPKLQWFLIEAMSSPIKAERSGSRTLIYLSAWKLYTKFWLHSGVKERLRGDTHKGNNGPILQYLLPWSKLVSEHKRKEDAPRNPIDDANQHDGNTYQGVPA